MIRSETYCGGRLVKEIDQVRVSCAIPGLRPPYVDGPARWRLDGERVQPAEAEAFWVVWDACHRPHSLRGTARSWPAVLLATGLVLWLTMMLTQFS